MFNVGTSIPGHFPSLERDGPNARFMRFEDLIAVESRSDELVQIARTWCDLKSAG